MQRNGRENQQEAEAHHVPVMLVDMLEALKPVAGLKIVDGTFGAGGYSRGLLEQGALICAIDRDPEIAVFAEAFDGEFGDRFSFVAGEFSQLDSLARGIFSGSFDVVVLDIGVSSMQLERPARGFSFLRDGPLDMRMSGTGESAADIVNTYGEKELANLIFAFGEEKKSRRIAKAIVLARLETPIETTLQLSHLIEKSIGRKPGSIHPATRTFQALRIAVNKELDELVEGLFAAERLLTEGGRLLVVTFHSLEDRIVKRFFDATRGKGGSSRHRPVLQVETPRWHKVAKALKATPEEILSNPRSRSAMMRLAWRTDEPARAVSFDGLGVPKLLGAA